jgi:hypothetical protein
MAEFWVADYVIINDGQFVLERSGLTHKTLTFKVPFGTNPDARSILFWKVKVDDSDGLRYHIIINSSHTVYNAYFDGIDPIGTFHEVVGGGILKKPTGDDPNVENTIEFDLYDGDGKISFSDVVILIQHKA